MNDETELIELTAILRRSLQARTADHHLVEDVTQETMLRVAAAQPQLEPNSLRAYAIVTARNTLIGHARAEDRARRHAHRVVDHTSPASAEERMLASEESRALAKALDSLTDDERDLLMDHEVDEMTVAALAERDRTTAGAVAMRLARARAVLRLEYLLIFRHIALPSNRCRHVLMALSTGDRRRQATLGVPVHLVQCETCSSLAEPLVDRRRGAAVLWFFPLPGWLRSGWDRLRTSRSAQAAIAGVAVALALGVAVVGGIGPVVLGAQDAPPATVGASSAASETAPSASIVAKSEVAPPAGSATGPAAGGVLPTSSTPSQVQAADDPTSISVASVQCASVTTVEIATDRAGCSVTVDGLTVTAVPADEGFWVMSADGHDVWVHLVGTGESPQNVHVGDSVSIVGVVRAVSDSTESGIPSDEADRLATMGVYVDVRFVDLVIE